IGIAELTLESSEGGGGDGGTESDDASDAGSISPSDGPASEGAPDAGEADGSSPQVDADEASLQVDADLDGAMGDADSAANLTVHGKLVDPWGHPISGYTIIVGTASAVTQTDGTFTAMNVVAPYDVKLVAETGRWAFVGLTRSDPTLQIYTPLKRSQRIA